MSRIILTNQASSPDDAGAGKAQLFAKNDGKMYKQIGTGDETELINGQVLNVQSRSEASVTGFSADSWVLFNSSLDVTITPQSSSSKFLLQFTAPAGASSQRVYMKFVRDTTDVGGGGASGSREACNGASYMGAGAAEQLAGSYLDSPATASQIVYHVHVYCSSGTGYLNRSSEDGDSDGSIRGTANFTVMEIAG